MNALQALGLFSRDAVPGLSEKSINEEPSAHPDLAVNASDRQVNAARLQGFAPREHVLIDAVNKRAVQIEDEGGRSRVVHVPGSHRFPRFTELFLLSVDHVDAAPADNQLRICPLRAAARE